jgi:hypothetical protein
MSQALPTRHVGSILGQPGDIIPPAHAAPGRALLADVETDVYRIVPESVDQHVKHVQARQGADLTRGPGLGTTVVLQVADA